MIVRRMSEELLLLDVLHPSPGGVLRLDDAMLLGGDHIASRDRLVGTVSLLDDLGGLFHLLRNGLQTDRHAGDVITDLGLDLGTTSAQVSSLSRIRSIVESLAIGFGEIQLARQSCSLGT